MKRIVLLILMMVSSGTFAGIMPDKSRLIYQQDNSMETLLLVNTNHFPVMVQLWVNDGDVNSPPEKASAPFAITPVLFKLAPSQSNGIKIFYTGEKNALPSDRESLFWLNVYEIPPKAEAKAGEEKMSISMLTQLKVIYRPTAIKKTDMDVIKELQNLSFELNEKENQSYLLTVNNPTPYVASFSTIMLTGGTENNPIDIKAEPELDLIVAPKSKQTFRFTLNQQQKHSKISKIRYVLVDDLGRYIHLERNL